MPVNPDLATAISSAIKHHRTRPSQITASATQRPTQSAAPQGYTPAASNVVAGSNTTTASTNATRRSHPRPTPVTRYTPHTSTVASMIDPRHGESYSPDKPEDDATPGIPERAFTPQPRQAPTVRSLLAMAKPKPPRAPAAPVTPVSAGKEIGSALARGAIAATDERKGRPKPGPGTASTGLSLGAVREAAQRPQRPQPLQPGGGNRPALQRLVDQANRRGVPLEQLIAQRGGPDRTQTRQQRQTERRVTQRLTKAARRSARTQGEVPSIVPPQYRKAVAKYGERFLSDVVPQGMTGPEYLGKLLQFESGFQRDAVSSAGAADLGQFMPGTAQTFREQYGVNPVGGSADDAIKAAAMHLSGKFGHAPLYAGYNPGYSQTDPIPSVPGGPMVTVGKPSQPIPGQLRERAQEVLGGQQTKEIIKSARDFSGANPQKPVPRETVTAFEAAVDEAKKIASAKLPYVLGGGHVAGVAPGPKELKAAGSGYDCSSTVSRVLQAAGVDIPTIVSGDFPNYTDPGPGAITIYSNPEHVFMKIGNRYFGTSSADNPGGGAGFIHKSVAEPEATSGRYTVTHPTGMNQQVARRMGIRVSATPGMTMSADGTTATINPGAGAVVGAPGASKAPIRGVRRPAAPVSGSFIPSALSAHAVMPTDYLAGEDTLSTALLDALYVPKRRLS